MSEPKALTVQLENYIRSHIGDGIQYAKDEGGIDHNDVSGLQLDEDVALLSAHDYWKARADAEKQRADGLAAALKKAADYIQRDHGGKPSSPCTCVLCWSLLQALAQESAGEATCGTCGGSGRRNNGENYPVSNLPCPKCKGTGKRANSAEENQNAD